MHDDFDTWLDTQIEQEIPISKLVLDLFDNSKNYNQQIHILNEYIFNADIEQINKPKVFSLVMDKFKTIYDNAPEQIEHITEQMYSVAIASGWWEEEPWHTMYLLYDYYYLITVGTIKKEAFMNCFSLLIYNKTASDPI